MKEIDNINNVPEMIVGETDCMRRIKEEEGMRRTGEKDMMKTEGGVRSMTMGTTVEDKNETEIVGKIQRTETVIKRYK